MLELIPPPQEVQETQDKTAPAQSSARLLTEAEVQTLGPIFAEYGAQLPDPSTSFLVGTVDQQGAVTSFLVVQLRVHAEPMWIKPGHEAVFRGLVHTAEEIIQQRTGGGCDVFLFAPAGKIARLAEVAGMRTEPWVVYSKTIAPVETQLEMESQPQPQSQPQSEPKKRIPIWQREQPKEDMVQ